MPIYEYKCRKCGKVSDFLEGVGTGKTEKICGYCGGRELEKTVSVSNVSSGNKMTEPQSGLTCCGRTERCEKPPCSDNGECKR